MSGPGGFMAGPKPDKPSAWFWTQRRRAALYAAGATLERHGEPNQARVLSELQHYAMDLEEENKRLQDAARSAREGE